MSKAGLQWGYICEGEEEQVSRPLCQQLVSSSTCYDMICISSGNVPESVLLSCIETYLQSAVLHLTPVSPRWRVHTAQDYRSTASEPTPHSLVARWAVARPCSLPYLLLLSPHVVPCTVEVAIHFRSAKAVSARLFSLWASGDRAWLLWDRLFLWYELERRCIHAIPLASWLWPICTHAGKAQTMTKPRWCKEGQAADSTTGLWDPSSLHRVRNCW